MNEDSKDFSARNGSAEGSMAHAEPAFRNGIPELVSEIYDGSPTPLRTKLLECLLRPVGPLALVALATGAFRHLLYRLTGSSVPVSLDDAARITSDHVLELARYVEQCSPSTLLQIGSLVADSPIGVATMSGSALLLALGAWRQRWPAEAGAGRDPDR
jgi:hypothetical protein